MISNQFSEKKQRKLMRFNEFVARKRGKDRAGLLAEEVIEGAITEAMFSMIDGAAAWNDRKVVMERFGGDCLAFSEGGGTVLLMAMVMR
jgi:hypothetical protein